MNFYKFLQLLLNSSYTFPHSISAMSEKKQQARKKGGKPSFFIAAYGGRLQSALRTSGRPGRPPLDYPHTAAAGPLHGPNPATRLFMGLHLFCHWSAGAGRVAPKGSCPRRGCCSRRPSACGPMQRRVTRRHAGCRPYLLSWGRHGANYGGYLATKFTSSLVNDKRGCFQGGVPPIAST